MYLLVNENNGISDINLYTGERVVLSPNSSYEIKTQVGPNDIKFYAGLNRVGIYLKKVEDNIEIKEEVNPIKTEVEAIVSKEVDEVETSKEEVNEEEDEKENDSKPIPDEKDLLKMRQAELISMANELGYEQANTTMSKKDIIKLIRGV